MNVAQYHPKAVRGAGKKTSGRIAAPTPKALEKKTFREMLDDNGYSRLLASFGICVASDSERFLEGWDRLFQAGTGNASNVSQRYTSVKKRLLCINELTQHALKQARNGFKSLSEAFGVASCYWEFPLVDKGNINFFDTETPTLDDVLKMARNANGLYLNWLEQVHRKETDFQCSLLKVIYKENLILQGMFDPNQELLRAQYGDDAVDATAGQNSAVELGELEKTHEREVDFLLSSRQALISERSSPLGFRTSKLGRYCEKMPWFDRQNGTLVECSTLAMAWPVPQVFSGMETSDELYLAALNFTALGEWLEATGKNSQWTLFPLEGESAEDYDVRRNSFSQGLNDALQPIQNAGRRLQMHGIALRTLATSTSATATHCKLCYRHVGRGKHTYCTLHSIVAQKKAPQDQVSQRTRLRQSEIVERAYAEKLETLRRDLQANPFYLRPSGEITKLCGHEDIESNKVTDPEVAIKRLTVLLKELEPIVGETISPLMHTVADGLIESAKMAYQNYRNAQFNVDKHQSGVLENENKARTAHQAKWPKIASNRVSLAALEAEWESEDAEAKAATLVLAQSTSYFAEELEKARFAAVSTLNGLSFLQFFSKFFGTPAFKSTHQIDPNHPTFVYQKDRQLLQPSFPTLNAFRFDETVRDDLVGMRAWYEVSGPEIDSKLEAGQSLGVEGARKRYSFADIEESIVQLKYPAPSYQQIADALNSRLGISISKAAVFQALKKAGKTVEELNPHAKK